MNTTTIQVVGALAATLIQQTRLSIDEIRDLLSDVFGRTVPEMTPEEKQAAIAAVMDDAAFRAARSERDAQA